MLNRLLLAAAVCVCIGCGPKTYNAQVTGSVTVDGQLANNGTVTFHPTSGGTVAYGRIQKDGTFALRVGKGDVTDVDAGTLPSGEYIVTVLVDQAPRKLPPDHLGPPPPDFSLSAAKYKSPSTSDLRRTVTPGKNFFSFELERATEEEMEAQAAKIAAAAESRRLDLGLESEDGDDDAEGKNNSSEEPNDAGDEEPLKLGDPTAAASPSNDDSADDDSADDDSADDDSADDDSADDDSGDDDSGEETPDSSDLDNEDDA